MQLIEKIRENAKKQRKKIVLPEGDELRMIKAATYLHKNKLVLPILIGDKDKIKQTASENKYNVESIKIINPQDTPNIDDYAEQYYEIRKHKGISKEDARKTVVNSLFFGALMVRNDEADGAVAGSVNTTGDVMRAAIQVIGMPAGISAVSSSFIMVMPDGREFTFGDCAVIPNPTDEQLASIAISSADTHKKLVGTEPVVAMLSFSTKGSAEHEDVEKVRRATQLIEQINPNLQVDGELQFDSALLESVAQRKAPQSKVAGKANVFIFPDLDAGNIGYKIAQRLAGAEAVGPVVQGLRKPYNDLSRGCSVDDIVNVACICSVLS
ncbi:MAG: phosphate acetyltransferase [Caldithrix sp.]|nr:phosphate acetyltransferase [Caldithrix sp.]